MRGKLFLFLFTCLLLLAIANPIQGKNVDRSWPASQPADQGACTPGSGWRWTNGPAMPDIAGKAVKNLDKKGILADVEATGYGETDSCGAYLNHGVDFKVSIRQDPSTTSKDKKDLSRDVVASLKQEAKPRLGNIAIHYPDGTEQKLNSMDLEALDQGSQPAETSTGSDPLVAGSFYRNVYVVILNPTLSNGQGLIEYMHWNNPDYLVQGTIDFFKTASRNQLQYRVTATTVVSSGWPEKLDGFTYDEASYLAVANGQAPMHSPDTVNYFKLLSAPDIDMCGRANRGEIDEVWVYNGPWFGFYESTLVGPGAYFYNSSPQPGAWTCNRLIPIMGPSPERGLSESMENFGHRSESTMTRTYRGWEQNRTLTNWDRFGLVKALSPNYGYSGCGSIHYPANGVHDYDWSNTAFAPSYCDDFYSYPNLPSPPNLTSVNCNTWDCNGLTYFQYWFTHFPHFPGCGPDNVSNMWWSYLTTPALANTPLQACVATPKLTLNQASGQPGSAFTLRGTGFAASHPAALSVNGYTFPDTVPTDAFGNFVVILQTSAQAGLGNYVVTVDGAASIPFTLDSAAAFLPAEGVAQIFALPVDNPGYLPAPSGLAAAAASQTQINLSWTDNAQDETGFRVEQSADGVSGWSEIAQVGANVTGYNPSGLACGTTYYYRVRAYRNGDGAYSSYSNTASAASMACNTLPAPTRLAASAVSQTQMKLTWRDNSTNESGFRVELSPNGTSGWAEIGAASANAVSYNSTNLTCGTTYYYRIRAYRAADASYSTYSNTASARTSTCPVLAPTNLVATAAGSRSITLTWQDNALDETNYRVERSLTGASGWKQIATLNANTTSYTNTGLTAGTTYYYRVRVYRQADRAYSSYSNVASAKAY